jgi:hypothetical protein
LGHYLIVRREQEFLVAWLQESEMKELLARTGFVLPDPNPEEAQTAKAAVEELIARERNVHQMIVASAPKPTWADIRAVWWMRIKSWFFVYTENGHFTGRARPLGIFTALGLSRWSSMACAANQHDGRMTTARLGVLH